MTGFNLALHGAVPVVLDGVVCSAWEVVGNLGPLIAILGMFLNQKLIFLPSPVTTLDIWIKMVVPPALQAPSVTNKICAAAGSVQESSVSTYLRYVMSGKRSSSADCLLM